MKIINVVEDVKIYKGELRMTLPRIVDVMMVDQKKTFAVIKHLVKTHSPRILAYEGIPVLRETKSAPLCQYITENTFPYDQMIGRLVKITKKHAEVVFTHKYSPIIRHSIEHGDFGRLRISIGFGNDKHGQMNVLASLVDVNHVYEIMELDSIRYMLGETRPMDDDSSKTGIFKYLLN